MATYPNKALFSNRPEICSLTRKLLKICQGWVDPIALGHFGQYGDELKIKKNVLLSMYPDMCHQLVDIFGDNATATNNITCNQVKQGLLEAGDPDKIFQLLHKYAKENLLWLNVYVKDAFATRIIRDERMTRISFVANVGGLLGLCMGFSLVSVAEILYFCLKRNETCSRLLNSVGRTKPSSQQQLVVTSLSRRGRADEAEGLETISLEQTAAAGSGGLDQPELMQEDLNHL